ncbi:hypothetical protein GJ496_004561 [Pomphorhynchus laevis]|nr:hypothetical protein GJ496_004561 [Pomphorhynchus laevis]
MISNYWKFIYLIIRNKYFTDNSNGKCKTNKNEANERAKRVSLILNVPFSVEPLLTLGFMQCLTVFFAMFTIVPLQSVLSSIQYNKRISRLRISAIVLATMITVGLVDMDRLYHAVRGQSIVKIYFIYNAVDLADRLLASMGQDIIEYGFHSDDLGGDDDMVSTKLSKTQTSLGVCLKYLFVLVYLVLHSYLILCQVTALNVAFNSHNKALFAVWISNNFAEVKQAVFKKFEHSGLRRICLNDIRERIHYLLCLLAISLRNMAQFNWVMTSFYKEILPYVILLFIAELFVDYFKHIAVARFNNLNVSYYNDYIIELLINDRQPNGLKKDDEHIDPESYDYINRCCRLISFSLLPSVVVFNRIIISITSLTTIQIIVGIPIVLIIFSICSLLSEYALFKLTKSLDVYTDKNKIRHSTNYCKNEPYDYIEATKKD